MDLEPDGEAEPADNTAFLSFIDVISCGLGAATLLFLVYSILPRASGLTGQASGIDVGGESTQGAPREVLKTVHGLVAMLSVELNHPDAQASWTPLPSDCEANTFHEARNTFFIMLCATSFDADVQYNLKLDAPVASGTRVRAQARVGGWSSKPFAQVLRVSEAGNVVTHFELLNDEKSVW